MYDIDIAKPPVDRRSKPNRWEVIIDNPGGEVENCVNCVLRSVFHESAEEAFALWLRSAISGQVVVCQSSSLEVLEAKIERANSILQNKACIKSASGVQFLANPCL